MKTLALLIDGDNAQLSATKHILEFCEGLGTLRIKKAYGDWEQLPLSGQHQTMKDLGITLVQQKRVTKNATDFRLAMDVALMLDKSEADIYFLVSSDGHFTAVCHQIHEKGARVVGIAGNGNASSDLRRVCDLFFDLDEVVKNPNQPSVTTSSTTQSKAASNPASKGQSEPKAETKTSPVIKKQVEPPAKTATVPQLKTSAVLKLLSKPTTNASPAPKVKAAPKPKAEVQPKVQAKPKAVTKPKVEAKPKITPKPTPKAKVKAASKAKVDVTSQLKAKPNRAEILEILIDVHQKASPDGGWVNVSQLGDVRPRIKQKFGPGFGSKTLSTWFEDFSHKFEVKSDRVRMK